MAGESARESARRQLEKAERLRRSAELHERGAQGEERTAAVLAALPPDSWTVIHDVRWPGRRFANVDHVVVGPPGVFVVDSKNWSGRISVKDNVLRCGGYRKEREVAAAAEAALAVAHLVPLLRVDLVRPVLCFVRDEDVTGWARDVVVCSTANIIAMLQSRPAVLTATQVRDVSLQLDARLSAATEPPSGPQGRPSIPVWSHRPQPASSPARPPAGPRGRRRARRKGPHPVRLLIALGLLALLVFAPQVVTGLGAAVAQLLVGSLTN